MRAFRFGKGRRPLSLLGGCHADEPVGPRLLRHLVAYLAALEPGDPWLTEYEWWIVPHINPDGENRNAVWADDDAVAYDFGRYLSGVLREPPGDDIEFGFPRADSDREARPENRAVFEWWQGSERPFVLHASMHGTNFAGGPWFLIEPAWRDRCEELKRRCLERVAELGYVPHDVERHGEKGFVRLGKGFCTRPNSEAMRSYFLELGDPETAGLFRPSSMETIRSFGGDALTLVTEMPVFITPGVGETVGPPDPLAARWRQRIEAWKVELSRSVDPSVVSREATGAGIVPMPVLDQMDLQWTFLQAGLDRVSHE